jgi:hypothetical protein
LTVWAKMGSMVDHRQAVHQLGGADVLKEHLRALDGVQVAPAIVLGLDDGRLGAGGGKVAVGVDAIVGVGGGRLAIDASAASSRLAIDASAAGRPGLTTHATACG